MTTISLGKQTGALPAAPKEFAGLVNCIIVAADPAATGPTYFQQIKNQGVVVNPANTIVAFNTPAATGGLGQPYRHDNYKELNSINPTEFQIGQANAGDGCFVTYLVL